MTRKTLRIQNKQHMKRLPTATASSVVYLDCLYAPSVKQYCVALSNVRHSFSNVKEDHVVFDVDIRFQLNIPLKDWLL